MFLDDVSVEEAHHFWYAGTAGRHVYQLQQQINARVSAASNNHESSVIDVCHNLLVMCN